MEWTGGNIHMKTFTNMALESEVVEELKNFMRNHADEIRKFRSIDNSRSITYSHAISYLMHRNKMK